MQEQSSAPHSRTAHTFGQHRKRIFWIGGSAIALVCTLLLYHFILAPYRHRGRACFGEPQFPANYSIHGIDVSHHQGTVNWEKVATASDDNGARVQFVFVKATQGKSHLDRKFRHNFRKAQQYGLVRGAYHYFSPGISGDEQAHHFINNVPLEKGDLPPVLDVEVLGRLKPETLRREVLEWLEMMEKRFGTPPIIYTYLTFKKKLSQHPRVRPLSFLDRSLQSEEATLQRRMGLLATHRRRLHRRHHRQCRLQCLQRFVGRPAKVDHWQYLKPRSTATTKPGRSICTEKVSDFSQKETVASQTASRQARKIAHTETKHPFKQTNQNAETT